jgi:hypothetical protein
VADDGPPAAPGSITTRTFEGFAGAFITITGP